MNCNLSLRAAIVDDAAEHAAARDPLTAIFVIIDLFLPRRFFGDRLVPVGQIERDPKIVKSGLSRIVKKDGVTLGDVLELRGCR